MRFVLSAIAPDLFISILGGKDECLVRCHDAKSGNGRSGFIGPFNKAG
jgi:hypothetical protein